MSESLGARIKRAYNAFTNKDPTINYHSIGTNSYYRPDRMRLSRGNERSIVTAIYNRIALDASQIAIRHVLVNDEGAYVSEINSGLNTCLSLEANIDQSGSAMIQDAVMSMFDEGSVAIVPVDTEDLENGTVDILTIRVGQILEWYPRNIKVRLYNERTGLKEDIIVSKENAAIVENPFYSIMNEHNSTMQRLIRKLNLLDAIDEQSGSGKLDLIIQLPYVIKTEARRRQADDRRKLIEEQLSGSKYGIAYTDGTEHITQLNRPVENNLMKQIEFLTSMLYSQLGITQSILDGTADEKTMHSYQNRIVAPVVSALVDAMKRSYLSNHKRMEGESIMFFLDPFKLIAPGELSEMADKLTRNEIFTTNEFRQILGRKPSKDPKADELRNKNLSATSQETPTPSDDTNTEKEGESQNGKPEV